MRKSCIAKGTIPYVQVYRGFWFNDFLKSCWVQAKSLSLAKLFSLLKTVLASASGLRCYLLKRKWAQVIKMHQSEMSRLVLGASSGFCQASLARTRSSYWCSALLLFKPKGTQCLLKLSFLTQQNLLKGLNQITRLKAALAIVCSQS